VAHSRRRSSPPVLNLVFMQHADRIVPAGVAWREYDLRTRMYEHLQFGELGVLQKDRRTGS